MIQKITEICPGIPMGRKKSKLNIIDYRINYNRKIQKYSFLQ